MRPVSYTHLDVYKRQEYSYRHLNVAAQETDANSYLNWTRYLVAARQVQPALRAGTLAWVETGYAAVLAFRRAEGDNRVLCVFNLSDTARPSGIIPPRRRAICSRARGARSQPARRFICRPMNVCGCWRINGRGCWLIEREVDGTGGSTYGRA